MIYYEKKHYICLILLTPYPPLNSYMLIYNTTYTVTLPEARNFVIWIKENFFPQIAEDGTLSEPKLLRILSHHDEETECFSVQFKVESSAQLHQWYMKQGQKLTQEMEKLFEKRIVGFSTLMEEID